MTLVSDVQAELKKRLPARCYKVEGRQVGIVADASVCDFVDHYFEGYVESTVGSAETVLYVSDSVDHKDARVIVDAFEGSRFLVEENSPNAILFQSKNSSSNLAAMRWLRLMLHASLVEEGFVPLHASCISKGGRAIALVGSEFSGKTTGMLAGVLKGGYQFLSNDCVYVRRHRSEIVVRALPVAVGIRSGAVSMFSELRDLARVNGLGDDGRLYLHPSEISHLGEGSVVCSSKLVAVFCPQFDPQATILDELVIADQPAFEYVSRHLLDQEPFQHAPYWHRFLEKCDFEDSLKQILSYVPVVKYSVNAELVPQYLSLADLYISE